MSQSEFVAWVQFYKLHPFDDYHRFYRPAALMTADVQAALEWLQPDPMPDEYSKEDVMTLRAFGIEPKKG